MSTPADDTQGLDEILRDFAKRVEAIRRGKTYGWENEKQAILGWVDKVVIGEDIYWNREQRMKFSTSDIDSFAHLFAVNSTKKDQRNILKQHGYKGEE